MHWAQAWSRDLGLLKRPCLSPSLQVGGVRPPQRPLDPLPAPQGARRPLRKGPRWLHPLRGPSPCPLPFPPGPSHPLLCPGLSQPSGQSPCSPQAPSAAPRPVSSPPSSKLLHQLLPSPLHCTGLGSPHPCSLPPQPLGASGLAGLNSGTRGLLSAPSTGHAGPRHGRLLPSICAHSPCPGPAVKSGLRNKPCRALPSVSAAPCLVHTVDAHLCPLSLHPSLPHGLPRGPG